MLWVSRVIEAPEAQAGWQGLDVSTVSHELCGVVTLCNFRSWCHSAGASFLTGLLRELNGIQRA